MDIQQTGGTSDASKISSQSNSQAGQGAVAQSAPSYAPPQTAAQSLVQAHADLIATLYPVHPERLWPTYTSVVDEVRPGQYNTTTRHFCAMPGTTLRWIAEELYGRGNLTGVAALLQVNPQLDASHSFYGGEQVAIAEHVYQNPETPNIRR